MRYRITKPGEKRTYTARFMVSYADCPHLCTKQQLAWYAAQADEKGKESSFVRSMQFGEFHSGGDDTRLFMEHDMEALRECMRRPQQDARHGTIRAGIDLSATGDGDPKIIYIADGTIVLPAFTIRIEDCSDAADEIVKVLRDHHVDPRNAMFDAGGSGKPIVDYIENRIGYRPVGRYSINQAPKYHEEYYDRATEDHYRFKRVLHTQPIVMPNDRELYDQCKTREIKAMEHDKIKLEPKESHRKRLRESPDKLDAIVMLFSMVPEMSTERQRHQEQTKEDENRPWKTHRPEELQPATVAARNFSGLRDCGGGGGPARPFAGMPGLSGARR